MTELQIKCGGALPGQKRLVLALWNGAEIHRDRIDTDSAWQRKQFREKTSSKVLKQLPVEESWHSEDDGGESSLHTEIEAMLIAAADVGDRSDESESYARQPVLVNMADVESRLTSWLWPNRIAKGRITLAVGMPGQSAFLCDRVRYYTRVHYTP